LADPRVDARIYSEQTLKKWAVRAQTGLIWLRIGTSGGICEHGNEPSGCTKWGEFLELLRNYQILRKDPPAWS